MCSSDLVITGFVGIIFIMQPWSENFNFYMLLPVMAAFGYSLARVTALNFSNDTPVPLINLYANIGTVICAIFLVITFNMWENFKSLYDLLILFIMGFAGGSGAVVQRKKLNQWFFNITKFSSDLLDGLNKLDKWPNKVKVMQKNFI